MKKVLIGCAIVAGLFVLTLIGGSVFVASWVKKEMPDFKQVEQSRDALLEQYGARDDYVPPLDGQVRPDRIEVFLAVRESLLTTRSNIAARTDAFFARAHGNQWDDRNFFEKMGEALNMARGGMGLFREGMEYVGVRANHLIAAGMGEGEYAYLYSLMVYSWLEWEPMEELGDDWFIEHDMESVPEDFRTEYRRIVVRQLRNLRNALEENTARTSEDEALFEDVKEAVRAAREAPHIFPYQGEAFPKRWAAVLEPYRARFVATLPGTPAEYLVDSIEQLIDDEETKGVQVHLDG